MKMITQMNKGEIEATEKLVAAMTDSERTLICKFGGDMYFNGYIRGAVAGVGGVLAGMLLYNAASEVGDIIRQRRTKKLIEKNLDTLRTHYIENSLH